VSSSSTRRLQCRIAAASSGSHGVEAGSPASPASAASGCAATAAWQAAVIPPWPPAHPVMNGTGDPHAAPAEVAVVAEHPAGREQFQQPPPGSGGLASDANQRLAPGAQFVGSGRDHHRILTYPHPGGAQRLVMTPKLTKREHGRLSHLTARRQRPPQGRTRAARQAGAEHQRRQLARRAQRPPSSAPPTRSSPCRKFGCHVAQAVRTVAR